LRLDVKSIIKGAVQKVTRSPDVAEIADRTACDALINDHLDNNRPLSHIRSSRKWLRDEERKIK